jgi:hypothetical protein
MKLIVVIQKCLNFTNGKFRLKYILEDYYFIIVNVIIDFLVQKKHIRIFSFAESINNNNDNPFIDVKGKRI